LFPVAGDPNGLDETLFPEVSEVALARIARPIVTVAEVAGGHDAKRANGRQRPALRPAERVFAPTATAYDFAVAVTWQIEPAREHVARVAATVSGLTVAIRPTRVLAVPMVGPLTRLVAVIIAIAGVVMRLDR
jgi:hypothetical protein